MENNLKGGGEQLLTVSSLKRSKSPITQEKDWTTIHPDFAKQVAYWNNKTYQNHWQDQGFNYEQTKDLLVFKGLNLEDYSFASWLRDDRGLNLEQIKKKNIDQLREEYTQAWENLHNLFVFRTYFSAGVSGKNWENKTRQQIWEGEGINYSEAREWIKIGMEPGKSINETAYICLPYHWKKNGSDLQTVQKWLTIGFEVDDYDKVSKWKNYGFTLQTTQEWLGIGFKKNDWDKVKDWKNYGFTLQTTQEWLQAGLKGNESELAAYARGKGCQQNNVDLTDLKEKYNNWIKQPQAQEWLDFFYSSEASKSVATLNISHKNLTGGLVIQGKDWPNLEEVNVWENQLTSLIINNCPKLIKLHCQNNPQLTNQKINLSDRAWENLKDLKINRWVTEDYLDYKYPKEQRKNISQLDIMGNNLERTLDLRDFTNLTSLNCSNNYLTDIDISNCLLLTELICQNNQISNLNLSQNQKLEKLDVSQNNFEKQDLSLVSHLTNLKVLVLESSRFQGSLEFLKNITKLEELNVSDTNIECGLEYLPDSIKYFYCLADRQGAKVKTIYDLLNQEEGKGLYSRNPWRKADFSQKLQAYKESKLILLHKEELVNKLFKAEKEISNLEDLLVRLRKNKTAPSVASLGLEEIKRRKAEKEQDWERASGSGVSYEEHRELMASFADDKVDSPSPFNFDSILSISSQVELELIEKDISHLKKLEKKQEKIERFQQERAIFVEQEKEIKYLEIRVQELIELIEQQKNKIMSSFLRLFPEKNLLQELIKTHLEFIRFKEQHIDSPDYDEKIEEYEDKRRDIKNQLRTKLNNKETMNNIQAILTDCEELMRDGLELGTKLANKSRLIDEHKKISLQITEDDNQKKKRKGIIDSEEEIQEQQIVQFKKARSNSITAEISRLQGERDAYKELAITSYTPIINNTNSSSNNMNDNSATYHDSQHNEHNQSQFHQQVHQKTNEEITGNRQILITQINQLQTQLEGLKSKAKAKLLSRRIFDKEKITQEREQLLQRYLTNSLALTKDETKELEKKLTKELLTNLGQTNVQLINKQKQLVDLQTITQASVVQTPQWRF